MAKRILIGLSFLFCQALVMTVFAQNDIELTDSTSTEWGGGGGGGLNPQTPNDPVTSMTISRTTLTLEGGNSERLAVTFNSSARNKRVIWTVANSAIAVVNPNGLVTGMGKGTTTVTATSEDNSNFTASCTVTVTSDYVALKTGWLMKTGTEEGWQMKYVFYPDINEYVEPVTDIQGHKWYDLGYDDSQWPTLTGPMNNHPDDGWTTNYLWTGDWNCFCLRRDFYLPSVSTGQFILHLENDDGVMVWINGHLVVNFDGWTHSLYQYEIPSSVFLKGDNVLAIYVKQEEGDTDLDYGLWFESRTPVSSITMSPKSLTLAGGERSTLTATVLPDDAWLKGVTWSVDNPTIASVSQNGSVRGLKQGTTVVRATAKDGSGISTSCNVTVTSDVTTFDVTVHVPQMGTLSEALAAVMADYGDYGIADIYKLTVTGFINDDDLYYLRDNLGATLHLLDLGEVTVENNSIGDNAIRDFACEEIVLPSTVESLGGWYLLTNCPNLKTIDIPSSVKYIGPDFGRWNASLETVTGGESITNMDQGMYFANTPNLKFPVIFNNQFCRLPQSTVGSYTVPDGVTNIIRDAMYYASELTALTLPGSVNTILGNVFGENVKLKDIYYYAVEKPYTTWDAFGEFNPSNCTLHVYESMVEVLQNDDTWSQFNIVGDLKVKGDVNGDGAVDIADAVCIVNHIVGKPTPVFNEAAADVNNDNDIDIADAVRIVNLIVGKIDAFARQRNSVTLPEPE